MNLSSRPTMALLRYPTLILAAILLLPVAPFAQEEEDAWPKPPPELVQGALTSNETYLIALALGSVNMSWDDMGFRKDYVDDDFRLDVAQRALDDPHSLVEWNYEWDEFLLDPKSAGEILYRAAVDLDSAYYNQAPFEPGPPEVASTADLALLPESWLEPVTRLDSAVRLAQDRTETMVLSSLSEEERAYLQWFLICHFAEDEEESEGCPEQESYSPPEEFLDAIRHFDLDPLLATTRELANETDHAVEAIGSAIEDLRITRPVKIDGASGAILIGTPQDDVWYLDNLPPHAILIEPGGNDTYFGPVAVAGNLKDESFPPVSVAIDFSGNDSYFAPDFRSCASGVMGIAQMVDVSGDDVYRSGKFSQGCGLFGAGILQDLDGNDIYDAGLLVQGAGAIGVGLLMDSSGNDDYRAALYAQGMAYTRGWGMLTDRDGFDTYWAGGVYDDFPRYPESNLSLSQGFAIGMRPKASGGVGILHDRNGNDFYSTEVYGQGVSYWYSVGALIDDNGNDWYQSQQYAQGSGIHLSSGILLDRAGVDRYSCRACTQGFGHDYAVGWLIDEGGSDYYTGCDLAQGSGNANGVGILVDRAGEDGYFGRNPINCTGHGNLARGYGSIGVLIDMRGRDTYTEPLAGDGAWWTKTNWGAGIDVGDDWWEIETDEEGNEITRTLAIPGM